MVIDVNGKLYERIESLYFSEDYRIFLVTGQARVEGGRRAYVAVKPYGELDDAALSALKQQAAPMDGKSSLAILRGQGELIVRDTLTGTNTPVSFQSLDEEVRQKLTGEANAVWDKFTTAAVKAQTAVSNDKPESGTTGKLKALRPKKNY